MITFKELFDLAFMTLVVGYIFMDYFRKPVEIYDPIKIRKRFDLDSFKFACMVTAPAIILHEMAHKFTALAFGLHATFHAAYTWLGIGVLLKIFGGFIFFVPGYVSVATNSPLQNVIIAGAGPFMNLLLFLGAMLALKLYKGDSQTIVSLLILTKKINIFLFILNMLPIGFFDGAKVFKGLFEILL